MQLSPGVGRISRTPSVKEPEPGKSQKVWSTAWLLCGMICLVPAAFLTWAFFAHILAREGFSSGSGPAIFGLVFVPLYCWFLAGPIAIVAAGWALRSAESPRWLAIGFWGGMSTAVWCVFLLGVGQTGAGTVAIIGPMGFASLVVVGTTAWRRRVIRGGTVA